MVDFVRTYQAKFTADTSNLTRATKQVDKDVADTEGQVTKSAGGMRSALGGFAAGIAGALTVGAVVSFGKSTLTAASDVQQAFGGIDSVFKDNAQQVKDWAASAAQSVGLSKSEYGNFATVLGSQLKGMGQSTAEAGANTNDLIKLGSDLAATYGGSVGDAVSAVSSLLKGERDPIERYGVSMKQVDVNAQLAAMGMSGLEGPAKTAAESQATLALLMNKTTDAQGKFAAEADTAAGAAARSNAQNQNLKASIGEALLPAYSSLLGMVNDKILPAFLSLIEAGKDFVAWIRDNETAVKIFVGVMGGLLAVVAAYSLAQGIATGSLAAWAAQTAIARAATTASAAAQWVLTSATAAYGVVARSTLGTAVGLAALWVKETALKLASSAASYAQAAAAGIARGASIAWAAATAAWTFATSGALATLIATTTATIAATVAQKAVRAATLVWTAAQWALNVALNANPIGLVVIALALLGGALYLAWSKSETFRTVVTGAWNAIRDAATASYQWIKRNAIDPLVTGFQWVIDKAGALRDGVVGMWNTLSGATSRIFSAMTEAIKAPFRDVFRWINSNVISNLNKVTKVFGVEVPSLPTGFATGGYTGPGGKYQPAGIVHADEYVVRKESQRRMRAQHPGWLDHVNTYGAPPGYAGGGIVGKFKGAVDWAGEQVSGAVSAAIDAITDPVGFVTKIIRKSLSGLRSIAPGFVGDLTFGILDKALDRAASWITERNAPPPGTPANGGSPPPGTGAWAAPLGGYRISAGFPSYPSGRSHTGLDMAAGRGTPIYAAGPGTVSKVAQMTTSYGRHVWINHGGGLQTIYAHMLNTAASVGQQVAARTLIGHVDSTGNSTGDHLHFEVRNPRAVDPRSFMRSVGVALAEGGIVRRPTMALIGEAGPEAVVPLNGRGIGDTVHKTYNITVLAQPGANQVEAGRSVVDAIRSYERAAGSGWRT